MNTKTDEYPPLQYLPESNGSTAKRPTAKQVKVINELLHGPKLVREKFFRENGKSRQLEIKKALEAGLDTLAGSDRDRLIYQTEDLWDSSTSADINEFEQMKIVGIMANAALNKNRFATINELASQSGYSRKRTNSILARLGAGEIGSEQLGGLRYAMMAKIFKFGFEGNIKAARLFMELSNPNPAAPKHLKIGTQNNLVQMSGVVITEEQIKALPPELSIKLNEILSAVQPSSPIKLQNNGQA